MAENTVTVLKFFRPDCAPCRMLAKLLEGVEAELPAGVEYREINADADPASCAEFGVRSVPAILFVVNGEAIRHLNGVFARDKFRRTLAEVIAEVQ